MNAARQRAHILQQQQRYADAVAEWHKVLAAEPEDGEAHAMLALCLMGTERYKEATREADEALRLAPAAPMSHYTMALVYLNRNFIDDACAAIQQAIALNPYDADFFWLLAMIRMEQRNWPAALEAAEQGLAIDPEHVRCTNLRAMALVKLGRRSEAGRTIDSALAKDPENALSHANQGWTLLHAGQHVKAMEHFREALRLEPNMEWARMGIVEALKSRHFVYRWLLMYFLWMARLSRKAQWGILIGGFLFVRFLIAAADRTPELAAWFMPVVWAYAAFALLTWLAGPMFNLLLRLNRFGRLVLSAEQVRLSNILGGLFLAAIAVAGVYFLTGVDAYAKGAVYCALLAIPVAAALQSPVGWPRRAMLSAVAAMVLFAGASVYFDVRAERVKPALSIAELRRELEAAQELEPDWPRLDRLRQQAELHKQRSDLFERSESMMQLFVLGMLATTLGGNALAAVRIRR